MDAPPIQDQTPPLDKNALTTSEKGNIVCQDRYFSVTKSALATLSFSFNIRSLSVPDIYSLCFSLSHLHTHTHTLSPIHTHILSLLLMEGKREKNRECTRECSTAKRAARATKCTGDDGDKVYRVASPTRTHRLNVYPTRRAVVPRR